MELNIGTLAVRTAVMVCAALASATVLAADPPGSAASDSTPDSTYTRNQSPNDARTAQDIDARLKADQYHLFRHVTVSVQNGVAQLSGFVYSTDALAKAKQIAGDTPGVTRVEDKVTLKRAPDNNQQPD